MLFLQRAHSPDHPPLDSNLLPTDYGTRALSIAPPTMPTFLYMDAYEFFCSISVTCDSAIYCDSGSKTSYF